jgi:hypothetical protein
MPRIRQDVIGTSFVTGSGFVLRSPRLLLREKDDNLGSYPTIMREGDLNRPGDGLTSFYDNSTIIFSDQQSPFFPSMLPRGSTFRDQAVDIIGEESDIQVNLPIRSFQAPTHLKYSNESSLSPFNENRVTPATSFYLSGTDPDVLPDFMSPIRSKMAIEIDITPQSDAQVMKNVDRRTVSEGEASIGDKTGFLYYNFDRKEWEQLGLQDPATGDPLYYDFAYSTTGRSGTFPYQFSYTVNSSFATTESLEVLGYSKIGSPSIVMGAPSETKYHATSSQALKLSNYIHSPFMLERVRVEFEEINAQRINGGTPPYNDVAPYNIIFQSGSSRDIDNYMFFIYRQNRVGEEVDSIQDVSSSNRHLIASASMTFWNSASLLRPELLHSPAFSYEFGLPYNDSYAVGDFTGSVNLEFIPAVCGPQFLGPSLIQRPNKIATLVANVWQGSTSNQNYQFQGETYARATSPDDDIGTIASKYAKLDHRATRKFGGESSDPTFYKPSAGNIKVSLDTPQSNISPYLLMPGDELVFGIEAGVAPGYYAGNFSHITGSFFRIKNKRCKVTLFGSSVKDGSENLFELNQNLTSDSIHETIGAERVHDQFQIEPISSYHGTFLDEIVTGSMAILKKDQTFTIYDQDNSRRVIARVTDGQAGTTGSLQRFFNMADRKERIYDSCLPDTANFLSGAVNVTGDNEFRDGMIFIVPYDSDAFEANTFYPSQFPYQGNPKRYRKNKDSVLVNVTPNIVAYEPETSPFPSTDDIVFRVGWKGEYQTTNYAHRHASNLSSRRSQRPFSKGRAFRYGISSTKPQFTSTCWKTDHYGFFRDMLEQRRDTALFEGIPPIKIRFISGSQIINNPALTRSQNLSNFATSSLPYFDDGIARNRSDNPDLAYWVVDPAILTIVE